MNAPLIHFFTPVIHENNLNGFPSIVNFAETYLNIGTRCYRFVSVKNNGAIVVTPSELPKHLWYHIALKIATLVISFGIFPLAMLLVKSIYRAYHPLVITHEPQKNTSSFIPSASLLEKQPLTILKKIFTGFLFSPLKCLQYTVLNKYFNTTINDHFIGWESIYKKMIETTSQPELDAFVHRVKKLYINNRAPSFKEKVHYLCRELWEDASQIPEIQNLFKEEKLTMNNLIEIFQYHRFKRITQQARNKSLIAMISSISIQMDKKEKTHHLQNLLSSDHFKKGDLKEKANLAREWLNSQENSPELLKVIKIAMHSTKTKLLSAEMLGYMTDMSNLHTLNLEDNHLQSLPNTMNMLTQLKTLNLAGNPFFILPNVIWNFSQLEQLSFSLDQLSVLPKDIGKLIGKLKQLKKLDVKTKPQPPD